jgi:hypothetical protein
MSHRRELDALKTLAEILSAARTAKDPKGRHGERQRAGILAGQNFFGLFKFLNRWPFNSRALTT